VPLKTMLMDWRCCHHLATISYQCDSQGCESCRFLPETKAQPTRKYRFHFDFVCP